MITLGALSVNVVHHCSNRCVNCSHWAPIAKPWFLDIDELSAELAELARHAHVTYLELIGGEPLLHPDLSLLAEVARDSGIVDRIGIKTNGNLLGKVNVDYVDEINVSLYPGRAEPDISLRFLLQRQGIRLNISHVSAFHQALIPQERTEQDARLTHNICPYRSCFVLEGGWLYTCVSALHIPGLLGLDAHIDGLKVEGASEADIRDYLGHTDGRLHHSCKRCAYAPLHSWRELAPGEDWMKASGA